MMNKQHGFTLVELLTVMVVMVAMATITVKSVGQFSFGSRYEITADRYDKIKTAILGNPNQTINGHPSVSGFVADMGRLPNNLQELLDNSAGNSTWEIYGLCTDTTGTPTTVTPVATSLVSANCTGVGKSWVSLGIGAGWRGAYIETTNNTGNNNALTDGWGRKAQCFDISVTPNVAKITTTTDLNGSKETNQANCETSLFTWYPNTNTAPLDRNYGWGFFLNAPNTNDLTIKSYGKDGQDDTQVIPSANEEYDKDFPLNSLPTVSSNDWQVSSTAKVTVLQTTPPALPIATVTFTNSTTISAITINGTSTTFPITINGTVVTALPTTISGSTVRITGSGTPCLAIYHTDNGIIKKDEGVLTATVPAVITNPVDTTFTFTPPTFAFGQIAYSVNTFDSATPTPQCVNPLASTANPTATPKLFTIYPRNISGSLNDLTW